MRAAALAALLVACGESVTESERPRASEREVEVEVESEVEVEVESEVDAAVPVVTTDSFTTVIVPELAPADAETTVIAARVDGARSTWVLALVDEEALFYDALGRRDGPDAIDRVSGALVDLAYDEDGERAAHAIVDPLGLPEGRFLDGWDIGLPSSIARLVELRRDTAPDGTERWHALRHVDVAIGVHAGESDCTTATELRVRDVDHDGEDELVVFLGDVTRDYDVEYTERACAVRGWIVGTSDLVPELTLLREEAHVREDVWSHVDSHVTRVFSFRDVDGDGHADVHLVETVDGHTHDEADGCDPDEPPTPESDDRRHTRLAWDCLRDASTDTWVCPADAHLGTAP